MELRLLRSLDLHLTSACSRGAARRSVAGPQDHYPCTRSSMSGSRRCLPIHPVPMRTTFARCLLVNFAVDPPALASKLPSHLVPDVHAGCAFVSIVIAHMKDMRPAWTPRALGITYNQVVYRAVVKCGAERGVTFLRSDADSSLMVAAGNALTFFPVQQGADLVGFVQRRNDADSRTHERAVRSSDRCGLRSISCGKPCSVNVQIP